MLQAEIKLGAMQREMRFTPLEDPTLPRGEALSNALAQELTQLFGTLCRRSCFARLTGAAQAFGLQPATLPAQLLQVGLISVWAAWCITWLFIK